MRHHAQPFELAEMIFEDNPQTKKGVDLMQDVLRGTYVGGPEVQAFLESTAKHHELDAEFLPITRISESVSWKDKPGARLLQVADSCAFIIRQFLEERDVGPDLHKHGSANTS